MNLRGPRPRSNGALSFRSAGLALTATLVLLSCSSNQRISKIGDRTYRIECEDPLSKCLAQVERPCSQGFKILEGSDERRTYGVPMGDIVNEKRTSKAIVKCRSDALLGGGDDDDDAEAADAADGPRLRREPAGTTDRPAPVCVPGTTQACVGIGGCAGGQSCLLDGTAFSPCQCAPAADPEPVPTTTTAPSASSPAPEPGSAPALPPPNSAPALPPPSASAVPTVPANPSP